MKTIVRIRDKVNGVWIDTSTPSEVYAGTAAPTIPGVELWVDTAIAATPALKVPGAGGAWIVAIPGYVPRGRIKGASPTNDGDFTSPTPVNIPGMTVTFTPVSSRSYKATVLLAVTHSVADGEVTVSVPNLSNFKQVQTLKIGDKTFFHFWMVVSGLPTSAPITYQVQIAVAAGTWWCQPPMMLTRAPAMQRCR